LDGRRIALVPRAIGAGDVEDYVYGFLVSVFYVAHLAEGVEDLGGDVGEDAGALGGDAIADEKKQEPGQELVDVIGGAEFSELVEKIGGKVVRIFRKQRPELVSRTRSWQGRPVRVRCLQRTVLFASLPSLSRWASWVKGKS
jgi:hypothetical protein